jgi:Na+/H+ antiporter NhaD/arsenite permease-like protein
MWKAESNKTPIEMKQWLQIGIPSTLIALIVSSCILIIFAEYFMY